MATPKELQEEFEAATKRLSDPNPAVSAQAVLDMAKLAPLFGAGITAEHSTRHAARMKVIREL